MQTKTSPITDSINAEASSNVESSKSTQTTLLTVRQMANRHQGLSEGGLRHILFHAGHEMEAAGVVIRFGRRLLIDEERFLDWLRAGHGRRIAGRKS